jgi:hypothetical protein
MHSKTRAALFAAPLLLASLVSGANQAVASPAPTSATSATIIAPTPAPDTVLGHWYTYYDDWFNYYETCVSRGETMIGPKSAGGVPGIVAYQCFKPGGDLKWSMSVYDIYS